MFNSSLPFPGPSADDFLWRLFLSYFFPLVLRMPPDTELNKKIRTDGKKPANTKVYLISKNKKVINESGKFRNFTLPYQQPADYTVANFFQFCSCEECSLNNFQFMCSTVPVFFFCWCRWKPICHEFKQSNQGGVRKLRDDGCLQDDEKRFFWTSFSETMLKRY